MNELSLALTFKVVDQASKQLKGLQKDIDKLGSEWAKMGAKMAAVSAAGAAALTGLAVAAINSADQMGDTAQKMAISTEDLSTLKYAAQMGGVGLDQLKTAWKELNTTIIEAQDPTSETAAIFKSLGVSAKNADGSIKSSKEVFYELSDVFSNLKDDAAKTELAVKLFGKAGMDMLPMLNQGSKGIKDLQQRARELGIELSSETAEAAGKFNDTIDDLTAVLQGQMMAALEPLLPILQSLAEYMLEGSQETSAFTGVVDVFTAVLKLLITVAAPVVTVILNLIEGFVGLGKAAGALAGGGFDAMAESLQQTQDNMKSQWESLFKLEDGLWSATAATSANTAAQDENNRKSAAGTLAANKQLKEQQKIAAQRLKMFVDLREAINREINGVHMLTTANAMAWELEKGRYKDLTAAQKRVIEADIKRLDLAEQQRLLDETRFGAMAEAATTTGRLGYENQEMAQQLKDTVLYGSQVAGVFAQIRAQSQSLTLQIIDLQTQLEVLQQSDPKNQRDIQDLTLRIQALQEAKTALESSSFVADLTKGTTEAQATANTLATWKKYIGDSVDAEKQLKQEATTLNALLEAGTINQTQFNNAMAKLDASRIQLAVDNMSDLELKVKDMSEEMEGTFSSFFYDAMQGQFTNIFDSFKQMLDRMVAEALAANLAKAMFGETGTSGSGGDFLTALAGMFGFREQGGPVTAGQPYIVGEKRAEVFIPKTDGTIIPSLGQAGAMYSPKSTNVEFKITAMDSQDVMRAMDKIKRPLTQMINGTSRTYNMG